MRKEKFLQTWTGMCWTVARTMQRTYSLSDEDTEDIVQSALLKLSRLKSAHHKKPPVWIRTVINNSSRDALSQILRAGRNTFSYDEPIDTEDGEEGTYGDLFEDPREHPDTDAQRRVMVERFMSQLEESEQQLIRWHLGFDGHDSMPASEIARRLGSTVRKVRQSISDVYQRMRSATQVQRFHGITCICEKCGEREILLLPVGTAAPESCVCLNCEVATEYRVGKLSAEYDPTNSAPLFDMFAQLAG